MTEKARWTPPPATCAVPGCEELIDIARLCSRHYREFRGTTGDKNRCAVPGCHDKLYVYPLCNEHHRAYVAERQGIHFTERLEDEAIWWRRVDRRDRLWAILACIVLALTVCAIVAGALISGGNGGM
jgi:hypothetical protein